MPHLTRRALTSGVLATLAVGVLDACSGGGTNGAAPRTSPRPLASAGHTSVPSKSPTPTRAAFDKGQYSLDDPNSLWVVVNKLRPLNPITYAPGDIVAVPVAHDNPAQMRKDASDALVAMFDAALAEGGGPMQIQSSWRPYADQVRVYNGWVSSLGKAQADRQSTRPRHSEHQLGLAVDISSVPAKDVLAAGFGATTQGVWLAANAYRFGYLLR